MSSQISNLTTGICLAVLTALLSGCLAGPDYRRAAPLGTKQMPASFAGTLPLTNSTAWKKAEPAAHWPRGSWWDIYHDPELAHLENLASSANQELAIAAARFDQARALADVSRAGLFPQVNFAPAYTRQRTSSGQPENGQEVGNSYTFGYFTVPVQASWELDLWGRVRRQVEAAQGRLQASADDREAAKLAIQSEVAVDYFTLRSLQTELELIERSVETFRRSLELTRNRRAGGIATDLDVAQAESQLRGTEAQLPAVVLQQSRLRHALAALCGQPATTFKVAAPASPNTIVPLPPISLPSELLERRPDIAAAERRMAAANADVGVAQTAFYPRVHLTGAAGFQSISASSLFDWPARFWSVGPSIDLPLFTGGRNRAQLALARAAYDEAVAQYRHQVLVAFQEVEDQLVGVRLLRTQLEGEQAALTAAQRTVEIANNRYRAGLVTYLEVAIAQSAALTRERTVAQLQAQQLEASAGLIRAIGGGWSSPVTASAAL